MYQKVVLALVVLSLALTFSSCSNVADQNAANKALVTETFEALNNRAYETLDQYMATDFVRHSQATVEAPLIESLEAFRAMLAVWDGALPDAKMTLHQLIAEGDLVAFYVTYAGTHTGPMGPYPPTGKEMSLECFGYHRIENGKIAETWVTWDNMATMAQLGLLPPPPGEEPAPTEEG
ncbi:MAG: ester cyclase [bacterium]|nr:ester cyclase [bacterium]